jgi:hypothetical protein
MRNGNGTALSKTFSLIAVERGGAIDRVGMGASGCGDMIATLRSFAKLQVGWSVKNNQAGESALELNSPIHDAVPVAHISHSREIISLISW